VFLPATVLASGRLETKRKNTAKAPLAIGKRPREKRTDRQLAGVEVLWISPHVVRVLEDEAAGTKAVVKRGDNRLVVRSDFFSTENTFFRFCLLPPCPTPLSLME